MYYIFNMRNNQLKYAKIVLYIRIHKIYKRKVILISLIKQIKLLFNTVKAGF